jgi:hypothetical protein
LAVGVAQENAGRENGMAQPSFGNLEAKRGPVSASLNISNSKVRAGLFQRFVTYELVMLASRHLPRHERMVYASQYMSTKLASGFEPVRPRKVQTGRLGVFQHCARIAGRVWSSPDVIDWQTGRSGRSSSVSRFHYRLVMLALSQAQLALINEPPGACPAIDLNRNRRYVTLSDPLLKTVAAAQQNAHQSARLHRSFVNIAADNDMVP